MIVVIADVHDNLPNLKTALAYANRLKAGAIFCLGDLTNSETLKYLAVNFKNKIYLVQGNGEVYDLAELNNYPNIENLGRAGGVIKISNKQIGLCHEPALADNLIKQGAQIIVYGHTHKPWEEIKNGAKLINPGNLCHVRYAPTFAVWDEINNKLELKIL